VRVKTENKKADTLALTCKLVDIVQVTDPDSGDTIELEVWRDPESNALLGVESSFMDGTSEHIYSPYNADSILNLPAEAACKFKMSGDKEPS